MLLYALRRLIYLVPVAFGVSLLVFALVHLAPGDPISAIVPPDAPKEVIDKLKEYYGFDKPLPVQYFRWLAGPVSGWPSCSSSSARSGSALCRRWASARRTRPGGASMGPISRTWCCRPSHSR